MLIGEAARRLKLDPRTIRYYEGIGLLPVPHRTEGGFRTYSEHDLERIEFIRKAQKLDLSLGEIREIVAFREDGRCPCEYVSELIDRKRSEIDKRMRELAELKGVLEKLAERVAAFPRRAPDNNGVCHVIERGLDGSLQEASSVRKSGRVWPK